MRTMMLGVPLLLASCGKKNTTPAPPPVGWHQEEGWTMSCYFPPDYAQMNLSTRRLERSKILDEILSQWNGSREDGVSFDEDTILSVETVLLGRPEKIEAFSHSNLTECKKVATGGTASAWGSWARALPGKLTAGECLVPFDFTMFDYLAIDTGWQRALPICQGDIVRISGTASDKFRISDRGPWINVKGDTSQSPSGELPCSLEGCHPGTLVLRFVSESGVENMYAVGEQLIFTAPEHGEISYRINDTTMYDNIWYTRGGLTDHTAIEISPMDAVR
jgi:hypothetical protein